MDKFHFLFLAVKKGDFMMSNVVEFVSFKLKKGVSEQQFLAASDEINAGFLSLQKGYINRKLVKKESTWADIVLWESMDDAMNAAKAAEQFTAARPYFECIEGNTCEMQHLTVVKSY
jgi:hypothetical protein